MRLILIVSVAALALAACDRDAPDNRQTAKTALPAAQAKPDRAIIASFDCDRARGQAQELICADANLAAMDREVARLAVLAAEPAAAADYALQRDNCGKADELRQCVMAASALKIHTLRQGSEVARSKDAEGISIGPIRYRCKAGAAPFAATFINSDPGAVAIDVDGQAIALDHDIAASGARYEGRWDGRQWTFWTKGKEATLTVPGKGDLICVEQVAG